MLTIITGAIGFLIGLGVLITFHELGHYYIARLAGVKILRFSIGFGKPLLRWVGKKDRTEYVLAAIPLGGYVAMMGQTKREVRRRERHRAFCNQPLWIRTAIVAAGPIANFILAIIIFAIINMMGFYEIKPMVGTVEERSIAAQAGFEPNDEIIRVNQTPTTSWRKARREIALSILKQPITEVEVLRSGRVESLSLTVHDPDILSNDAPLLQTLGITPKNHELPAIIGQLSPTGTAAMSDLQVKDKVLAVNGEPISNWRSLVETITSYPNQTVIITVDRNRTTHDLSVEVGAIEKDGRLIGRIGASPFVQSEAIEGSRFVSYSIPQALKKGVEDTINMSYLTIMFLGKMIVGDLSLKNINGPVTIAEITGKTFNISFIMYLTTLALLSISIGIINLLPIPVLDGGHLLFYLIEFITRSPVSEAAQEVGQKIGLGILGALILLALYNDIVRLMH